MTTAGGTNTPVAGGQFTFKGATPTVTAVAPTSGPTAGGTTVTITGTGFTGATQVAFGPVAATRFTVVSDTQITAVAPAQSPGTRFVAVTTPGGATTHVAAAQFTYQGAPTGATQATHPPA